MYMCVYIYVCVCIYSTMLVRENVMNSLVMIQPALLEYSFEAGPPRPVLLDVASMQRKDVILLLDSFFHVVVWSVLSSCCVCVCVCYCVCVSGCVCVAVCVCWCVVCTRKQPVCM